MGLAWSVPGSVDYDANFTLVLAVALTCPDFTHIFLHILYGVQS